MASTNSLTKLAIAISVVTLSMTEGRYGQEQHPLMSAGPEVDAVMLPDGGISKRMHRRTTKREKSHAEVHQMRQ